MKKVTTINGEVLEVGQVLTLEDLREIFVSAAGSTNGDLEFQNFVNYILTTKSFAGFLGERGEDADCGTNVCVEILTEAKENEDNTTLKIISIEKL